MGVVRKACLRMGEEQQQHHLWREEAGHMTTWKTQMWLEQRGQMQTEGLWGLKSDCGVEGDRKTGCSWA